MKLNKKTRDPKTIFIFGAPRSGTTWLGKIFDSHPDVLYRHEPDITSPAEGLPWFVPLDDIGRHLPVARDYLEQLVQHRSVKSVRPRPMLAKRHQGPYARLF